MSRQALAEWLSERHSELLNQLNRKTPEDAVTSLNWITGLHMKYVPGTEDKLCAAYLSAMKGANPMSMSHYNHSERVRYMEEMQKMPAMQSAGNPLAQAAPKVASPNPEPNPVLLLLGEDE